MTDPDKALQKVGLVGGEDRSIIHTGPGEHF